MTIPQDVWSIVFSYKRTDCLVNTTVKSLGHCPKRTNLNSVLNKAPQFLLNSNFNSRGRSVGAWRELADSR